MWKFDTHCDVLLKLWESERSLSFYEAGQQLHVQYQYMVKADIKVQAFAIFVPPDVPVHHRFHAALEMIDIFYEEVVGKGEKIRSISSSADLDTDRVRHGPRGALLTLEGADALQGNITYLRTLYRLGVRSLGLTWNWRNEAADGVEEPNPGGLSKFGRELVEEAQRLGIAIDISHLSEKGFWDVMEMAQAPVLASHSNCKAIHNHQRNLTDEQIKAIIQNDGVIGLTFVPSFVAGGNKVTIRHLLKHVEHVCSLGGEKHLGFGSDFDGITKTMADLSNQGEYEKLQEILLKHYPENVVRGFLFDNWQHLYKRILA